MGTLKLDRQPMKQVIISAGYTIKEIRVNVILIYLIVGCIVNESNTVSMSNKIDIIIYDTRC